MSHLEKLELSAERDDLGVIRVSGKASIVFGASTRELEVVAQVDGTADWYTLGQEFDAIWRAVRWELTDKIIRDQSTWIQNLGQL